MLIVPESITDEIREFAATLSDGRLPEFVDVVAASGAAKLNCWNNVERECRHRGGQAVKGWRIWWIPRILIEGQAHVVWQSEENSFLDVTPNEDNEGTCVFVANPNMKERPGIDCVPSRHKNLCGEASVDEYIRCAAVVAQWQGQAKVGAYLPEPLELATMRRALEVIAQLRQRQTR